MCLRPSFEQSSYNSWPFFLAFQNVGNLVSLYPKNSVDTVTSHNIPKYPSIWATSWENLFRPYASNKGADQLAHLRSLISTFVVCCLDSIIPLVSIFAISWSWLACFYSWAGWFESYLVKNLKTGFFVKWLICETIFLVLVCCSLDKHLPWPSGSRQMHSKLPYKLKKFGHLKKML